MTDLALAQWLTSPSAAAILDHAQALEPSSTSPSASITASGALRRAFPELSPEQCAAAMTQVDLRRRAVERYGINGSQFLTRDGLEQATQPVVASRRAAMLVAAGCTRVADLTAGLGFDSSAFVAAGLAVTAVERSPETAVLLAANVPSARLVIGDATDNAT
ncbi:MAG: class I SAM-dependent methyltransferase, partial [Actinobacteria bacterium]|nr:class I SAM-dependent methyltransferase [Actinomycetota bacterium]